jgi:hypothetical protein
MTVLYNSNATNRIMEKLYFLPGDLVEVRQKLDNKPTMYVVKKVTKTVRISDDHKSDFFQGILCRWFTTQNELQEAVFNTKDLYKINS